jgi:hypothetical protein
MPAAFSTPYPRLQVAVRRVRAGRTASFRVLERHGLFAVVLVTTESCEERDSPGMRPCGVTVGWPLSWGAEYRKRKRPQLFQRAGAAISRPGLGAESRKRTYDSFRRQRFQSPDIRRQRPYIFGLSSKGSLNHRSLPSSFDLRSAA